jgi:G3E family GTPase
MASGRFPEHGKIPVTVLTGFLGSGKTTVLNALVRNQALRRTAVIINEFGEIGLDHDLVQKSDENFVLVSNGCVCCTVRGDLIATLEDLSRREARGEIEPLERVVIETTGQAEEGKELVELQPEVIVAHSSPVVATLLGQTRNIPIIFVSISDPIGEGFVASFARQT